MDTVKQSAAFASGEFFIGCNYWASNAGTNMWKEFDEAVIRDDFAKLAAHRVKTLRVFPLWPDFQPLRMHLGGGCSEREMRIVEEPMDFTPEGRAGVNPEMARRFERFCDLAADYGLKLIVGLITGWMSGRMHIPEALIGRNPLSDPMAIKWEVKFVRYMVGRFAAHPAIMAWDLGNECNCMGELKSSEQAYVWADTITAAIRREDARRPVVSGMHSLSPDGIWRMQDQGEFLDILCTHPYPLFTPHCDTDPLNQMKSALHATAESCLYADLGGIPCFCEEIGTLGPMFSNEQVSADYAGATLFTLLQHDCRGFMWWCANEQLALTHTPYDWNSVERQLGLFHLDKTPKPIVEKMRDFDAFVERERLTPLPQSAPDAVCVLTRGQDVWAVAYGAFILAKQAGLTLRFCYADGELPEADAYLLPSLKGDASLSRRMLFDLMARVEKGATLYLSLDDTLLSPFDELTGMSVTTRARSIAPSKVTFAGADYSLSSLFDLTMRAAGATVLAADDEGNPVFSEYALKKGRVFLLTKPVERLVATTARIVDGERAQPLYKFYEALDIRDASRIAASQSPTVCLTEHAVSNDERILLVINYESFAQTARISLDESWRVQRAADIRGEIACARADGALTLSLPHNAFAALRVVKA